MRTNRSASRGGSLTTQPTQYLAYTAYVRRFPALECGGYEDASCGYNGYYGPSQNGRYQTT